MHYSIQTPLFFFPFSFFPPGSDSNLDAVADVAIQEVAAAGGTGIELDARAGVHIDSEGLGRRGGLCRTAVVKGVGKPF